jgi:predicted RecB family nuclease
MYKERDKILFSASDLADFIECRHLTALGLRSLDDSSLVKKEADEATEILQRQGIEHEKNYLEKLERAGKRIREIRSTGSISRQERVKQTLEAMQAGSDVIYQAAFDRSPFMGYADFLLKVEGKRSRVLGTEFSYEIADTKLARSGKARHLVQIALYSDLLEATQGVAPDYMHLELGDGRNKAFRVSDYRHYLGALKKRFLEFVEDRPQTSPEKCGHCGLCQWAELCTREWQDRDHLNQVANIRAADIRKLRSKSIDTLTALAETRLTVPEVGSFETLKLQAALQLGKKRHPYEDKVIFRGLATAAAARTGFFRLPEPDEGDLYFDMEGYPYEPGGLEYLFGVCYRDGDGSAGKELGFKPFWGHDRAGEKKAFEDFIDFVVERIRRAPKLHIYHYADYERRALKKLMQIHGTREKEVDELLRQERLVDLYAVVRHAIVTSEPRYSIKNLETFYMKGERASDVKNAGASIVYYENWRRLQDQKSLDDIERYNEEDCVSTAKLHAWLNGLRASASKESGGDIPWHSKPSKEEGEDEVGTAKTKPRSAESLEAESLKAQTRKALETALCANSQDARAELLLQLFDFYWRELKPSFWKMYDQQEKTAEDLIDDLDAIGGLTRDPDQAPTKDKLSLIFTYRMPGQEHRLKLGDAVRDVSTLQNVGAICKLDSQNLSVDLRIGAKTLTKHWDGEMPVALSIASSGRIDTGMLDKAIVRLAASAYGDKPSQPYAATWSMLRREPPSVEGVPAGSAILDEEVSVDGVTAVVERLRDSYLIVQGPPGTGKTYTGARVIVALLKKGKRVGVCATSHKAIANLLEAVTAAAIEQGFKFEGARQKQDDGLADDRFIRDVESKDTADPKYRLVGGTAWVFARDDAEQAYDYLFVDEAGQVSLANLVAMSRAARNVVLLGDQMQLGQPLQGTHPGESGLSALQYLLQDHATVPPELGILLNVSWRMHPKVCDFISQAVYDGRLTHRETEKQSILLQPDADPALKASGIVFDALDHEGCAQTSKPEAERINALVASLCRQQYVDKEGIQRPLGAENFLVVAPYNAQVRQLKEVLPACIKVGTVDKFQGQECEVVIVSMTTSSGEEMPRNMEFLFDRNRLNVAISRAKTLAIVVASPKLLEINCSTPEQMALVNTLCWIAEVGASAGA